MKKANLAVVGASGAVGRTILKVLEEREFPISSIAVFASPESAGQTVPFRGEDLVLEELKDDSFKGKNFDIALFSAGGEVSEHFAPLAAKEGVLVVDNSSAWRMNENVPLPVPEVNPDVIMENKGIIANPNCSTIQSVVALKPIYEAFGVERIVFSTYQACSGAGLAGISDLENKETKKFPRRIDLSCIPQIDVFEDNGYTKEEMKMIRETRKIFQDDSLRITATAVRVPIANSHAVSINVETKKPFTMEEVFQAFDQAEGVVVVDDIKKELYPLQEDANGKDQVFVGRIRRDESLENGLNFWCVADNIRKGAATNTVQIAEYWWKNKGGLE